MFTGVYGALLIVAIVVSVVGAGRVRAQGRYNAAPDVETLAWLAGKQTRLTDALVTRKLAAGDLVLAGRRGKFATPTGTAVPWSELTAQSARMRDALVARLRREGLLMTEEELGTTLRWAGRPLFGLAGVGLVALIAGTAAGMALGGLAILLIVTLVLAVIRRFAVDARTVGGKETLARAQQVHDRLRRAPTLSEMDRGVALFGTGVLAGSAFTAYHQFRSANSDGGGSSDSSSGGGCGGDSGCGGGGCGGGGCGGGGD